MGSEETARTPRQAETVDEFIDILACPACRGTIRREGEELCCNDCGRRYPIVDGIPVMMVDEKTDAQQ